MSLEGQVANDHCYISQWQGTLPTDLATTSDWVMPDYRIDDLAREAGTTVRNVRVYQERGLLPPPRRSGRVSIYGDAHLARLRLIGQLLDEGYTFSHIAQFIDAWQEGRDLGDVLGLEEALAGPWSDEP